MTPTVFLSTVTPVYRGARTLIALVEALDAVRQDLEGRDSPIRLTEAIFVDDGSQDGSEQLLRELAAEYPWVTPVFLSRNYGQHPATMAGILHASGDWVATLDEDLQHHPRYLLDLLQWALAEGHDLVYANPEAPVHRSLFRDRGSSFYKWLIGKLSGNPNIKLFNSYRMMRGSLARAASAVAANQTYFDLAVGWFTTRVGAMRLPLLDSRYAEERQSGYRFRSLLSHAKRMLQSSDIKILRIAATTGFFAMAAAIVAILYTVALKLITPEAVDVAGWASVFVMVLFLGGLNAFLTGVVLEHLSLVLMQAHGKPTFFEIDRGKDEVARVWLESEYARPSP